MEKCIESQQDKMPMIQQQLQLLQETITTPIYNNYLPDAALRKSCYEETLKNNKSHPYSYSNKRPGMSCSWFVCQALTDAGVQLEYLGQKAKNNYFNTTILAELYAHDETILAPDATNAKEWQLLFRKQKKWEFHHVAIIDTIDDTTITLVESRRDGWVGRYSYPKHYFNKDAINKFILGDVVKE